MKWNLDDIPVFLAVIDQGGITAAARVLGAPKSTVSVSLARLEQAMGLRLVDRSSRRLRATAEGEAFLLQAQRIMEQAREADALMAGLGAVPSGRLRVALPNAFTQERVAPQLPHFWDRYPAVQLDILATSHGVDLLRDRVDLAVVVGQLEDSEFVSRVLLAESLIWVASPDWLARRGPPDAAQPRTLAELRAQVRICETRYALRQLPVHIHGESAHLDLQAGIAHVNDPLVVRRAVMAGAGIAPLPRHYCSGPLADGRLVEVCGHIRFDEAASRLTAVWPGRRLMSPRVRVFLDFLAACCSSDPSLMKSF